MVCCGFDMYLYFWVKLAWAGRVSKKMTHMQQSLPAVSQFQMNCKLQYVYGIITSEHLVWFVACLWIPSIKATSKQNKEERATSMPHKSYCPTLTPWCNGRLCKPVVDVIAVLIIARSWGRTTTNNNNNNNNNTSSSSSSSNNNNNNNNNNNDDDDDDDNPNSPPG